MVNSFGGSVGSYHYSQGVNSKKLGFSMAFLAVLLVLKFINALLDSRFKSISPLPQNQFSITDPQSDAISQVYTKGFLDYFHSDLGVSKKLTNKTSAYASPGFKWDWSHRGNEGWGSMISVNTAIDMADAMNKDPNVRVLLMNGYYDLATVFYGVEHTIDQMNLRPEIRKNIILTYYEGGHMFYTHLPSLQKFKKDLADFIKDTTK